MNLTLIILSLKHKNFSVNVYKSQCPTTDGGHELERTKPRFGYAMLKDLRKLQSDPACLLLHVSLPLKPLRDSPSLPSYPSSTWFRLVHLALDRERPCLLLDLYITPLYHN